MTTIRRSARRSGKLPALVLLASGLLSCTQESAPGDSHGAHGRLDKRVPELMQELHVPGVAIAMVDRGGPILMAAYGYTDESKATPIQDTTVFEAASLGKPLFSYAVLQHEGDPPFDLDRPVADYLDAPLATEPESATITGRQILSHTSGLVFSESDGRRHVASPPGSQWHYSGLGFSVLQEAVEQLWSESLEELVHETVTGPLKMENSSYLPRESMTLALGHDRQGSRMAKTVWSSASAASSLHTSVSDYGRFMSAMLAGLRENDNSVAARMVEPQIEVDGTLNLSWGLGWAIAQQDDETVFLHWGSNPGFKSLALGSVEHGIGMVVLTNGDNGLELATALVPIVFGHDYPFLKFYMLHPDD